MNLPQQCVAWDNVEFFDFYTRKQSDKCKKMYVLQTNFIYSQIQNILYKIMQPSNHKIKISLYTVYSKIILLTNKNKCSQSVQEKNVTYNQIRFI
jgi:hypothetical protein